MSTASTITTTSGSAPVRDRKIAIITGANRGLGRDTALRLAEAGTDLIITYRSHGEEALAVAGELTSLGAAAHVLQLDTADVSGFPAFADAVRGLLKEHWDREDFDFLVNNAGSVVAGPFTEITEEGFDQMVNVHLKGVFFLTQTLVPLMADGGRIINLSTGLARFTLPGMSAYATVKGGVEVLTRYLAKELGARGITANTVAPGPIATDFGGGAVRDDQATRAALGGQTALGRVGEPEDIGGVIASLLAPLTGWINGQRVEASGGALL